MGEPRLGLLDRLLAWLVSGPLGRGVAFTAEFALALGRVLARRLR